MGKRDRREGKSWPTNIVGALPGALAETHRPFSNRFRPTKAGRKKSPVAKGTLATRLSRLTALLSRAVAVVRKDAYLIKLFQPRFWSRLYIVALKFLQHGQAIARLTPMILTALSRQDLRYPYREVSER